MGETSIEWCDFTFNPWRGCAKVSNGCAHCYAEAFGRRQPDVFGEWGPTGRRVLASEDYWGQPGRWNARARREGRRFRVFCGSLMDVFEDRPELAGVAARERLWHLISRTEMLDWLLLTKRPGNFRRLLPASGYGLPIEGYYPNVWLGVSAEDQKAADERIPLLLQTPAAVRFVSYEPALGPVDCRRWMVKRTEHPVAEGVQVCHRPHLDWVIVGGESGPGRRPMDLAWLEAIDRQTLDVGIPLFVKQWSGPRPGMRGPIPAHIWARKEFPGDR